MIWPMRCLRRWRAICVRFWGDYIDDRGYIYDHDGEHGGLDDGEAFAILGDLNVQGGAVADFLLENERVNGSSSPRR